MSVNPSSASPDSLVPPPATHSVLLFIFSSLPPHPLCPALFHPSIIVFYLHLAVAWGEIAHPLIVKARLGYMVHSLFLFISQHLR